MSKAYIVTLKDSASDAEVNGVKEKVSSLGGSVVMEYSLIKGFVAKLPEVHAALLKDHEHVHSVELDKEVHTQ